MIAYCGLDCGKCDAYLATINDDQALREKTVFCDSLCGIRQCALNILDRYRSKIFHAA